MAIITDTSVKKVGNEMQHATDASAAFARVEPLLTPEQLTDRHLPGIPLVSALPDPVTKKRFQFTPDLLKDYIVGGISKVEFDVGVNLSPVEVTRRLPFDANEYKAMGYFQLPDMPVQAITSLQVSDASLNPIFDVPLQWVERGGLQFGRVNIIPLQPAFVGGGIVTSDSSGGAAFIAVMGARSWVAAWWTMKYITGFPEGRVPRIVNDIIGARTAIDVLQKLQATNRIASYGLSLDGASQNVSSPGPQVYKEAIEELTTQYQAWVNKLKAKFYRKFHVGNV